MTKDIEHVFFDLDHTLWDFDKNSKLTFEKIFDIHKLNVHTHRFLEVYEPINFEYWKLYREEKVTKSELRYGRLKKAFDAINFFISDTTINDLSEDYITYLTTFNNVFDGTHEILNYLKKDYQLHIITNGFEEAQEKKLEASNLKSYFNTMTNSEMVGVKKPNPRIFNFALNIANARPENSIMIGDSLEADVQGALNVGMSAVYFDYKDKDHKQPYHRITKLSEIKDIL